MKSFIPLCTLLLFLSGCGIATTRPPAPVPPPTTTPLIEVMQPEERVVFIEAPRPYERSYVSPLGYEIRIPDYWAAHNLSVQELHDGDVKEDVFTGTFSDWPDNTFVLRRVGRVPAATYRSDRHAFLTWQEQCTKEPPADDAAFGCFPLAYEPNYVLFATEKNIVGEAMVDDELYVYYSYFYAQDAPAGFGEARGPAFNNKEDIRILSTETNK